MMQTTIRSGVLAVMILVSTGALYAGEGSAVSVGLVRDGTPTASVVIAKQATRSARLAASELQYHVQKITGATLPIVADDQAVKGPRILVGESEATRALKLRSEDFQPQEYLIKFLPETIVLMGRDKPDLGKFDYAVEGTFPGLFDDHGTCSAVYDFLERHLQVRWYLPTELGLVCPAAKTLQVSGSELRRSPAMKYREFCYKPYPQDLCGDTVKSPQPPPSLPGREQALFFRRHRLGGAAFNANHSLYGYYDRFWKEKGGKPGPGFESCHPEFFAQGYQGRPPQMCYTNPDLVRQVVQDARDYFDGKGVKPGSRARGDFFPVVPMDVGDYCKCPRCAEVIGHDRSNVSNYVFAFVNEVAREVKKSHPQKHISTLAYWTYTAPPTKVKLDSNVWVEICILPRADYASGWQAWGRAKFDLWMAESKERTKLVWLWYCFPSLDAMGGQFRCFPGFFAHAIVRQMQVYHQAGIYGIFIEPSYLSHGQCSALMDQLEFYVTWKLADDPTLDGNALIEEFFDRYYGSAAKPMKAFYELVERTYADPSNYPAGYTNPGGYTKNPPNEDTAWRQTEEIAWKNLGTESRMEQLGRLMDEARAAARTDIEKQRVALFDKGIWQYMQAGRKAYLQKTEARPKPTCRVIQQGKQVELCSPTFVFRLDATRDLRTQSWENRLTGKTVQLSDGPELEIDIGLPDHPLQTPALMVSTVEVRSEGETGEVVFTLAAKEPAISAVVTYRWDAKQPVLRKFVTITNRSGQEWNRLLNVRLGSYQTDAKTEVGDPDYPAFLETRIDDLAGKTRGFPAYVERQFFVGLAHPAGFATRQDGKLSLRQLPGIKLAAGASFECMETVYGVSREGQVRQAFRDHVQSRMRRVLRGHDKPLAIFEPFGAKPDGDYWETEAFVADNIAKVAEGQRNSGLHWDYYSIDFWTDPKGDLKTPSTKLFPNGFTKILPELKKLGTLPGLWVDSGRLAWWTIGDNPALAPAVTTKGAAPDPNWGVGPRKRSICRATAPANQFYIEGFAHQMHENGVRLVKFDNALLICNNPAHEHLPGDYSVEPLENALIEFCRSLDRECPDVFIVLYWNYQSPWWLQYGDVVYDIGMHMEAASFSTYPALRARDSVTRRLDRGRWMLKDWPALGWDTLGVWLSDWGWNSRIGKEAWQGGVIMDISRGHLLAQIWSDTPYLSPDERRQMADFIALLKAQPECFRAPRFILGNPWKDEPYGYCCTDGKRAFLAINNGVWRDSTLTLELNSAWGLPDGKRWDVYRWWPNPAKLGDTHGSQATIALRAFDIVLLEVVPAGERPTLDRKFESQPMPATFAEPSRELPITVENTGTTREAPAKPPTKTPASETTLVVRGTMPPTKTGGSLAVSDAFSVKSNPHWTHNCKTGFTIAGTLAGKPAAFEPVVNNGSYAAPWQTWRLPVAPSDVPQPFELRLTSSLPMNVEHRFTAHFVPR